MVKLVIKYYDGSSLLVENKRKNPPLSIFKQYLERTRPERIESAVIKVYPLKDNTPFVLIQEGKIINTI